MQRLSKDVINFFQKSHFTIVSTVGSSGRLHNACKGIVEINYNGRIYLLDLYLGETFKNLKRNSHISITAVDEHSFKGYCLKGKAKIAREDRLPRHIIKSWEKRISSRISHRLLKNIRGEKGHPEHPEALFPKPEYMIVMEVEEIVDLTPRHLK